MLTCKFILRYNYNYLTWMPTSRRLLVDGAGRRIILEKSSYNKLTLKRGE